jgi:hypothetical protein
MRTSLARVAIVLSMIASLVIIAPSTSAAPPPHYVTFPWVPNGAMLGELGPFTGAVTIQNLESVPVTVRIYAHAVPSVGFMVNRALNSEGSITISAEELGVPSPGSAVIAYATFSDGSSARIAGTMKQSAPIPPDNFQLLAQTGSVHTIVDGYTGYPEFFSGSQQVVLPIVQTNNGWNTVIRVRLQLVGATTADNVTITLREAGGGTPIEFTELVSDGQILEFDLLSRGIQPGFVGSAVISTPTYWVSAVAERYKESTNMLVMNRGTSSQECESTQFAPLVFDNYFFWNTGISVANLGTMSNNVKISYFGMDGTLVDSADLTIPAQGMNFIYTPASGTGDGFLGAAVIEGSQPFCAAVDEVKYIGEQPDVGHAMSYVTSAITGYAGQQLRLPLAQRGSSVTGLGDTSGIQIFNVRDQSVVIEIFIHSESGQQMHYEQLTLGANESATVYLMGLNLAGDFRGSATIDAVSGSGWVTAISNNVNYAVQYDGSASYGLVLRP